MEGRARRFVGGEEYWLTRLVFQRGLALVYFVAFLVAANQFVALLGEHGLLPVPNFVRQTTFIRSPSLFFLFPQDRVFQCAAWLGVALAIFAATGLSEKFGMVVSMSVWGLMWLLYLSFVNVGQTFYAFGWETMLLEVGFLAIFLGDRKTAPSFVMIVLLRWALFRTMFGAGLIKLRGDSCWKDLTCLYYHYETQPIPNPFSWYFHWQPQPIHRFGVVFNHFTELVVPFGYFAPRSIAAVAGLITLFFHGWLSVSGNFAFLGMLTMVLTIPSLNDKLLRKVVPLAPPAQFARRCLYPYITVLLAGVVAVLSIRPVRNLISPRQAMNTSYDALHLVNSYGAFGSITRPRYEVIVEGTDERVLTSATRWREYEFKGKPGDVYRRPSQIAPYHLRLDWLMWFAGFSPYTTQPWFINFAAKLLEDDPAVLSLLRVNPFPQRPPTYVRALLYEYRFTTPAERAATGAWWVRTPASSYFPAVSLDNPSFRDVLRGQGWLP